MTTPQINASGVHNRLRDQLQKWLSALAVSLVILGATGCATPSIQMGKTPQFDQLDNLTPGVSTMADVTAVLGEPQGHGATRSTSFGFKDAWLYESMYVEGTKSRMRMLMVFFEEGTGIYHGHMWMASGALFSQIK